MDIYDILQEEHALVLNDLERLLQARPSERKDLVTSIIDDLTAHSQAEDSVLYDRLAQTDDGHDLVLEAKEEHLVVNRLLEDLMTMRVDDERFHAKIKVLTELVRHHVEEEEEDLFAVARRVFDEDIAENFAGEFLALRQSLARQPKLLRLGTARVKRVVEDVAHVIQPQK